MCRSHLHGSRFLVGILTRDHTTSCNYPEDYRFQRKVFKVKLRPITGHEGPEGEYRYTSTLSLTSTLDEGECSRQRSGRFTLGKETQTQCPFYRRLGGPQGPDGEYRYTSTLSLTSTLDEGECSRQRSGRFTLGKETQCPFYRRLGGPRREVRVYFYSFFNLGAK
jgi:hypothetical protein